MSASLAIQLSQEILLRNVQLRGSNINNRMDQLPEATFLYVIFAFMFLQFTKILRNIIIRSSRSLMTLLLYYCSQIRGNFARSRNYYIK